MKEDFYNAMEQLIGAKSIELLNEAQEEIKRIQTARQNETIEFMRVKELLELRIKKLESAIRDHRDVKADDRCIENDDELYEALGDGIKCDRRVGSKEDMLKNCANYIEKRCEGGKLPSYKDLINTIEQCLECIETQNMQHTWDESNTIEESIANGNWCQLAINARNAALKALGKI